MRGTQCPVLSTEYLEESDAGAGGLQLDIEY